MTTVPTGYSGTPLARKLGLKPGQRVWFDGLPPGVRAELDLPAIGVSEQRAPSAGLDVAHIFVMRRAALDRRIAALRGLIAPAGCIWVSWPKKAARTDTDLTEDAIRAAILPTGLVDIKVCAVDATWSALKLVVRTALR